MKASDFRSGLLSALRERPRLWYLLLGVSAIVSFVGAIALLGSRSAPGDAGHVLLGEELDANLVKVPLEAQKSVSFAVAESRRQKLESRVTATGIVSPDQTRYAHITPLGRGIVEKVYVNLGDPVRKDQPLVSYDNVELGELIGEHLRLLGELEKLEAQREVASKVLNRARALLEVEAIARQEFELRDALYQQALASVQSQKADLARVEEKLHRFGLSDADIAALRSSPHDTPHRTASHSVLRAAFNGIIIKYEVSPGELVDRDQKLFTLVDTSSVWVLADLYEKDIGLVRASRECRVQVASYPGEVFSGEVTYVSDFLDPASRTAKVRCVVPNRDGRLKLEMFATVSIPVLHGREALTIPVPALQEMNGETVVFVPVDETRFEKRVVSLGDRGEDWLEVLNGLREGEKVVTAGSFYLKSTLLREQIGGEH